MNDIEWEEGAVCFAGGKQWMVLSEDSELLVWHVKARHSFRSGFESFEDAAKHKDFQLNEIRAGDYIPASELDTEQKYNDAVAVFELFGFPRYEDCTFKENESIIIVADSDGDFTGQDFVDEQCKRKITYPQLMAIGKLKLAMIEKSAPEKSTGLAADNKLNKSKQAYDILKSLDYEYDLVKQKWFRKEWV